MHRISLLLLLFGFAGCASAPPPADAFVWQLDGVDNRIYLAGSVHLLRAEDYPLPQALDTAYQEAEHLVMELDMDELDPLAVQQLMSATGMAESSLRELLGEETWSRAETQAAALGIDLTMLNFAEPWLAALTIVNLQAMKAGYDPRFGVEEHYAARARADAKPVSGLETMAEQIGLFDSLSLPTQRRLMLQSIEEAHEIEAGMDTLVSAWKTGDAETLQTELEGSFEAFPGLYETLVVQRNRNWLDDIEALRAEQDDYLIIVGALHLVGKDSVIEMLRAKGYRVQPAR